MNAKAQPWHSLTSPLFYYYHIIFSPYFPVPEWQGCFLLLDRLKAFGVPKPGHRCIGSGWSVWTYLMPSEIVFDNIPGRCWMAVTGRWSPVLVSFSLLPDNLLIAFDRCMEWPGLEFLICFFIFWNWVFPTWVLDSDNIPYLNQHDISRSRLVPISV